MNVIFTELGVDSVPHVGEMIFRISGECQKAEHLSTGGFSRTGPNKM